MIALHVFEKNSKTATVFREDTKAECLVALRENNKGSRDVCEVEPSWDFAKFYDFDKSDEPFGAIFDAKALNA